MEIVHVYSFKDLHNGPRCQILDELRIKFECHRLPSPKNANSPSVLVFVKIAEGDSRWKSLLNVISAWDAGDQVETNFIETEKSKARFNRLRPTWHHGYPMPDDDDGYLELTYEASRACPECGIGYTQKSEFLMKGEPKWGSKHILQLNWIFDEYFVIPEVYEKVFKPLGIPCRPVRHFKTQQPLQTVVQLVVDKISEYPLEIDRKPEEICKRCGLGKYHAHSRGFFPRLKGNPEQPIFKTQEYFGSGASAWRAIIISQDLYRAMSAIKLKGVTYYPLAD